MSYTVLVGWLNAKENEVVDMAQADRTLYRNGELHNEKVFKRFREKQMIAEIVNNEPLREELKEEESSR